MKRKGLKKHKTAKKNVGCEEKRQDAKKNDRVERLVVYPELKH